MNYDILGPVEADSPELAVKKEVRKSLGYESLDHFRLTVYEVANGYHPAMDTFDPEQAGVLPNNE
jgi:hypothetical protein